jgi:hypothetical protein
VLIGRILGCPLGGEVHPLTRAHQLEKRIPSLQRIYIYISRCCLIIKGTLAKLWLWLK